MTDPERLSTSASPEVRGLVATGWQPRALDPMTKRRVGRKLAAIGAVAPATLFGAMLGSKAAAMTLVAVGAVAAALGAANLRDTGPSDGNAPGAAAARPNVVSRQSPVPLDSTGILAENEQLTALRDAGASCEQPGPQTVTTPDHPLPTHAKAARAEAEPTSRERGETRSSLADELTLLDPARRALARSPTRTLNLVENYRSRFPAGQLRLEAAVLEIRALVQLGRREEARELAERARSGIQSSLYNERIARALGD